MRNRGEPRDLPIDAAISICNRLQKRAGARIDQKLGPHDE